jgi:hypothetical protein
MRRYVWAGLPYDRPANSLRGISSSDLILQDGNVSGGLFTFQGTPGRGDGLIEESINWHDDDNALPFTLEQPRLDGTPQFKGGVAVIPTEKLAHICALPMVNGRLSYERAALDENPYHGNLLLHDETPKPTRRMISNVLAMHVTEVVRP